MKTGSTSKFPGLLIPVLLVFILLAMVFLVVNQIGALNEARNRLDDEERALRNAESGLQRLIEIRKQTSEFERYLSMLEHFMPKHAGEDSLISSLGKMAEDTGLKFAQIRFNNRMETDKGYTEIPLDLVFQGDYRSFLNLMQKIQKPQEETRALRVENLKLNNERLELNVTAFYDSQFSAD